MLSLALGSLSLNVGARAPAPVMQIGAPVAPAAGAYAGNVVPTGASSGPTAAQLEAVADFKMITETEATIRKVAGVGMGLATAFHRSSPA